MTSRKKNHVDPRRMSQGVPFKMEWQDGQGGVWSDIVMRVDGEMYRRDYETHTSGAVWVKVEGDFADNATFKRK